MSEMKNDERGAFERKLAMKKMCLICGKQFRPRKDGCFPEHTVVFVFDDMPDKDGNPYVTPRAACNNSGKPITDRNSL